LSRQLGQPNDDDDDHDDVGGDDKGANDDKDMGGAISVVPVATLERVSKVPLPPQPQ
jgi:hypothetical protein